VSVPITDTFDPTSPEVIAPNEINPPQDGFPEIAIVPFATATRVIYNGRFDLSPLPPLITATASVEVSLLVDGDFRAAVDATLIGAPTTVALMEEMIAYEIARCI
jgi:hypothetical protein